MEYSLSGKISSISDHDAFCVRDSESVKSAIEKIFHSGYRRLPVVSSSRSLVGLLTTVDVLKYFCSSQPNPSRDKVSAAMNRSVYTFDRKHQMDSVLKYFDIYGKGAYPLTSNKKLHGIISEFDFLRHGRPRGLHVYELMTHKPMVLRPSMNLRHAALVIARSGTRRLPVLDKSSKLVGIITPTDILSMLANHKFSQKALDQLKVSGCMVKDVLTIKPTSDISVAHSVILKKKVGGLPVVLDGRLVGMFTERDLFDAIKMGLNGQVR